MKIKEILVLHHSHFDVGYTHSQPILWELQREFLDGALTLLDQTQDYPTHARPRWTCEVTAQVIKWLESATPEKIDKFQTYLDEKRIGISAMLCHTTPLANAEQLMRQLYPAKRLRDRFGISLNTLNQHDVNGVPWSFADIMIDAGIDLFIMAINRHLGGFAAERPAVIRWKAPSGRILRVMNGAHYTMFDQLFNTHKNDIAEMQDGIDYYIKFLHEKKHYRHDFIYLTTANAPVCYDNSPPNIDVANLIRQWNDEGRQPLIRYVTPEQLGERINELPEDEMPEFAGDWTDYWNFGCASNAAVTKVNINAKPRLYTRDMIAARHGEKPEIKQVSDRAWWHLNFYDEHTWGAYNSIDADTIFAQTQAHLKDVHAYEARELADYLLVNELEALAENPPQADHQDGVLLVNAASEKRLAYIPIPDNWFPAHKRLRTARLGWNNRYEALETAPLYGPVELAPFSWQKLPLASLKAAEDAKNVTSGEIIPTEEPDALNFISKADTILREPHFIESPFYRLEYEAPTGRITALIDRRQDWQILDTASPFTFFEFVHESPDTLVDGGRTSYYKRNLFKEKYDVNCWQTDWKSRRQTATKVLGCRVEAHPRGKTLVIAFEAPGCRSLEQHITLLQDEPVIELSARINKDETETAESIFFAFPLNLPANWRSHFDSAGVPMELDAEQLPGSCRDWVTVETFASVYGNENGVTLFCPDAPMVQIGDFNFGKNSRKLEKQQNPLLLAWPLNSYWDTNFRKRQPGFVEIRYTFKSFAKFDAQSTYREGRKIATPVEVHPLINCKQASAGEFLQLNDDSVEVLHVKPAEDGNGAIYRMINLGEKTSATTLAVPGRRIKSGWITSALEENHSAVTINNNCANLELLPRQITSIRLEFE